MILDSFRYFYCFYKSFFPLLCAFLLYCTVFFQGELLVCCRKPKVFESLEVCAPPGFHLISVCILREFENATVVLWSGQAEWYNLCLWVHYGTNLQLRSFFALPFSAFLIQISSGISTLVNHLHICPVTEPASE